MVTKTIDIFANGKTLGISILLASILIWNIVETLAFTRPGSVQQGTQVEAKVDKVLLELEKGKEYHNKIGNSLTQFVYKEGALIKMVEKQNSLLTILNNNVIENTLIQKQVLRRLEKLE